MKNIYLANFSMTINPGNHKFLPYSVAGLWNFTLYGAPLEYGVEAGYRW